MSGNPLQDLQPKTSSLYNCLSTRPKGMFRARDFCFKID